MTTDPVYNPPEEPNWRKPVGMILMLLFLVLWSGVAVNIIDWLEGVNFWLQLPVYIFLGIAWIFPIRPFLRWMNTGSFRKTSQDG